MKETSSFAYFGEHPYETFRTGDNVRIEDLVVEPIHVDHSIPAAYGFLIHTSEGAIVYTGDLRAHGPRKDMTEEFAERAHESEAQPFQNEVSSTTRIRTSEQKTTNNPNRRSKSEKSFPHTHRKPISVQKINSTSSDGGIWKKI